MWWLLPLVGGAAILCVALQNKTNDARERWDTKREELEDSILELERKVENAIRDSIDEIEYKSLIDLHYASMRVANDAYKLRNDARMIIDSYKDTLTKLKQRRDEIYPLLKDKSLSFEERNKYRDEFNSHGTLRQGIFEEFKKTKAQHSDFNEKLFRFNAATHKLKNTIRDNCGWRGKDWFDRLEARTKARKNF